ncbi:MAG: hypothetical protein JWL61_3324 [Gemmatimonadetes bacterium]|nr:hypothetical protein [Gemmatimonadota bacterium]
MRHVFAVIALGACACGADLAGPDVQAGPVETVQPGWCWAEGLTWMAVQSDAGPWTRVLPDAQHTFRATLSKRGGIAIVRGGDPRYRDTRVFYGTASELKAQLSNCLLQQSPWKKMVTGAIAGVPDGASALVGLGSGRAGFSSRTDYSILFEDGPRDLVALRALQNSTWPNRVIVRRALNVADGSRIPLLDFDGAEAAALVATTLTITGIGGEGASLSSAFGTATSEWFDLSYEVAAQPKQMIYSVPAALTQPGDHHNVILAMSSQTEWRITLYRFRDAVDRTISLGPSLTVPATNLVATTPYLRHQTQFLSQADYADGAAAGWHQENATGGGTSARVMVTRDYLGGRPESWNVIMPDLTAAGYDPAWGLQPGLPIAVTIEAIGGNSFAQVVAALRGEEGLLQYAVRDGSAGSNAVSILGSRIRSPACPTRIRAASMYGDIMCDLSGSIHAAR